MYYAESPCITDGAGKFCIANPKNRRQSGFLCIVSMKSTIAFHLEQQGLRAISSCSNTAHSKFLPLIPSCLVNWVLKGMVELLDSSRTNAKRTR